MSWIGKKPADQVTSGQQLADGTVSLSKLLNGIFAVGATGLAKFADGFFTADAAGRAKVADGFVTQAKLAANVVGNGPAFSAYANVGTSVNNNVFTKVAFQVEDFDTNSFYNNTASAVGSCPAYAFQPTIAGYYQVNWSAGCTSQAEKYAGLFKNGGLYRAGSDAIGWWSAGSALVYMNGTTDYLEVYFYQLTGGVATTYTAQAAFSASLVRLP
jgi:hypothetical protein